MKAPESISQEILDQVKAGKISQKRVDEYLKPNILSFWKESNARFSPMK